MNNYELTLMAFLRYRRIRSSWWIRIFLWSQPATGELCRDREERRGAIVQDEAIRYHWNCCCFGGSGDVPTIGRIASEWLLHFYEALKLKHMVLDRAGIRQRHAHIPASNLGEVLSNADRRI